MATQQLQLTAVPGRASVRPRVSNTVLPVGATLTELCPGAHLTGRHTVPAEPVAPRRARRATTAGTRPARAGASRTPRVRGGGVAPGRQGAVRVTAVGGGCAAPSGTRVVDDVPTSALVAAGLVLAVVLFVLYVLCGGMAPA